MKLLAKQITNKEKMNSLQISELTGIPHNNIKRTIKTLIKNNIISLGQIEVIKVKRSRRYESVEVYIFTGDQGERDSIIVIAQVSPQATAVLVDEWRKLKEENETLKTAIIDRQNSRLEAPELTAALKEARSLEGKDTLSRHYINEYNLLNKLVLGTTAKKYIEENGFAASTAIRDTMRPVEIKAMAELQRANTNLIDMGLNYQERKPLLIELYNRKFKQPLIDEVMRAES